jgi:hypothetical protein
MHRTRNAAYGQPYRGFESLPLRQIAIICFIKQILRKYPRTCQQTYLQGGSIGSPVSRYRPSPAGVYLSDESSSVRVGRSPSSGGRSAVGGNSSHDPSATGMGQRDGEVGNIYHLFEKKGGVASEKSLADPFPNVKWVSLENGLRTVDDGMEDKAATFIRDQNTLLVNADFRVFTDMTSRLSKEKESGPGPGLQDVVKETVHQWFEVARRDRNRHSTVERQ